MILVFPGIGKCAGELFDLCSIGFSLVSCDGSFTIGCFQYANDTPFYCSVLFDSKDIIVSFVHCLTLTFGWMRKKKLKLNLRQDGSAVGKKKAEL